jgi:hypothetical protein
MMSLVEIELIAHRFIQFPHQAPSQPLNEAYRIYFPLQPFAYESERALTRFMAAVRILTWYFTRSIQYYPTATRPTLGGGFVAAQAAVCFGSGFPSEDVQRTPLFRW